ncbi:MAG: response regulator transcription factor [Caldilineaceae bacterium]|nr:response regulator transcription factor [Caldilineaceae bacterium]
MVVDDQPVVRSGLSAFLMVHPDLELVGEASDGARAVRLCPLLRPDVILMDLVMPQMDGAEATQVIRERYPHIQVIALTSFKDKELVQRVLDAGAIGYLLKNVSSNELADAIRSAYSGRPTLSPEATQVLIEATTNRHKHVLGDDLTEREKDVLVLMVDGLNNTQIAEQLVVSRSTVKFHVSNILSKLESASRMEAIALAVRNKLVPNHEQRQ